MSDFELFSLKESTQFNPQEVDVAGSEANHGLGITLETLKKEKINTQYLQNQEKVPRYRLPV